MNDIDLIYQDFCHKTGELKTTFLDVLSPSTMLPTLQETEFCKAFVVLFHASLEDYFEKIALKIIANALLKYRNAQFVTQADLADITQLNEKIKSLIETYLMIVSFATFKAAKKIAEDFSENENNFKSYKHEQEIKVETLQSIKTTSQYVDNLLKESNNILRSQFDDKNHGVGLPNLVEMLTSVGIDINKDLILQNSLRRVAYYRGDYAHRGISTRIIRIFTKQEIEDCYTDCLTLCTEVYNVAKNKI